MCTIASSALIDIPQYYSTRTNTIHPRSYLSHEVDFWVEWDALTGAQKNGLPFFIQYIGGESGTVHTSDTYASAWSQKYNMKLCPQSPPFTHFCGLLASCATNSISTSCRDPPLMTSSQRWVNRICLHKQKTAVSHLNILIHVTLKKRTRRYTDRNSNGEKLRQNGVC